MAAAERLRRDGHDPVLVSAVLTQSRLRRRAREKFGDAMAMARLDRRVLAVDPR